MPCSRLRMAGTDTVHGVRDAGDVLVQHRVHVHLGAVPHVHAELHARHLLRCGPRGLTRRTTNTAFGERSTICGLNSLDCFISKDTYNPLLAHIVPMLCSFI